MKKAMELKEEGNSLVKSNRMGAFGVDFGGFWRLFMLF